ncbi:MAG: hypothetical protein JXM73_08025 [Anaerolineae bacterium]|nr:hypothetical protein [Anaerolineae bacterium]
MERSTERLRKGDLYIRDLDRLGIAQIICASDGDIAFGCGLVNDGRW